MFFSNLTDQEEGRSSNAAALTQETAAPTQISATPRWSSSNCCYLQTRSNYSPQDTHHLKSQKNLNEKWRSQQGEVLRAESMSGFFAWGCSCIMQRFADAKVGSRLTITIQSFLTIFYIKFVSWNSLWKYAFQRTSTYPPHFTSSLPPCNPPSPSLFPSPPLPLNSPWSTGSVSMAHQHLPVDRWSRSGSKWSCVDATVVIAFAEVAVVVFAFDECGGGFWRYCIDGGCSCWWGCGSGCCLWRGFGGGCCYWLGCDCCCCLYGLMHCL